GGVPGASSSLGTGAIAVGWDGEDGWRRVDGWGHLLGDRGGGAWLGMRGLNRARAALDGTDAARAALLRAATWRLGEPLEVPGHGAVRRTAPVARAVLYPARPRRRARLLRRRRSGTRRRRSGRASDPHPRRRPCRRESQRGGARGSPVGAERRRWARTLRSIP